MGKTIAGFILTGIFTLFLAGCSEKAGNVAATNSPPANNTLRVNIAAPQDSQSFAQDEIISFSGTAVDGANTALAAENLSWTSDKDGIIGVGNDFKRSGLSVNHHTIMLVAADPSGNRASANLPLIVRDNANGLVVLIDSPAAGTRIKSFDLVRLEGAAFDYNNNPVNESLSYQWKSDLDGVLGTGPVIEPGGLTAGLQRVILTASSPDSNGNSLQNNAAVEFWVEFDNDPGIQAEILAPVNGYQHPANQPIPFNGAASEPNGDPVALNNIIWTSARDGEVGRGESCVVPGLSEGTHRITMTVTGLSGRKNTASITIEVN